MFILLNKLITKKLEDDTQNLFVISYDKASYVSHAILGDIKDPTRDYYTSIMGISKSIWKQASLKFLNPNWLR